MSLVNLVLEAARQLFKGPPTLEDYVQSQNPTDTVHVEFLEKQYYKLIKRNTLWG